MTKEELEQTKKALRDTRIAATKSRETAIAFLQEIGMLDENGELTKEYSRHKAA